MDVSDTENKKGESLSLIHICHCAVSEGKSAASQYDIVLCSKNFVSMFADAEKRGTKIVGLKNVMSAKEIEEGLAAAINK